jgi:DNA polymerase I
MRYVIDIEADNLLLDVTTIWCIVLKDIDTGKVHQFTPDNLSDSIELIESAELLIAHNGIMYDLPVLNKLLNIKYDVTKVFDTLLVSRILHPDRDGGHSLDAWGKRVGCKKGDFKDFSKFSQEMLEYCIQDVEVTHKIFNILQEPSREIWDAILIENEFAYNINHQIQNGFTLDLPKVNNLQKEYQEEYEALYNTLQSMLPKVKDKTLYNKCIEKGLLLSEDEFKFSYITEKTRVIKEKEFKLSHPNPGSRQQIISYLKDTHRWVPQDFTEKDTPKVDETILNSLPYPEAKMFGRMFRLQKLMGMIENPNGGWKKYLRPDNKNPGYYRVHGDMITVGTSTSRCSHSKPNLGQVDKKDKRMREVWIPRKGWKLVGCDASGLELRILGHYLYTYDKGRFAFKASASKEVADLHADNQKAAGLLKRDSAKTLIYAMIYGAGDKKLGTVVSEDRGLGKLDDNSLLTYGREAREGLITELVGYDKLVTGVSEAFRTRGFLRAIDGRPLHPRSDYSALNLLIQSAGAIVMKVALNMFIKENPYKLGVDYALCANVHDEFQVECRPGIAEKIGKHAQESIKKAGQVLKFKVTLDGEYAIGDNWGDTH